MNDIIKQAHQGSTAAIIQVMNEELADLGVRTRAVLEQGILQVLCEATEENALKRDILVPRLKEILEGIEPRNLSRVNIFSRITQDQQLLWLNEIQKDPNHQLLWSEQIKLRKGNFIFRWVRSHFQKPDKTPQDTPKSVQTLSALPQVNVKTLPSSLLFRTSLGIAVLCLLSFWAGLAYNQNQQVRSPSSTSQPLPSLSPVTEASPVPNVSPSPTPQTVITNTSTLASPTVSNASNPDPFAEAVRLAEQMSIEGQTAKTRQEWLYVASQWQKASELMASVPSTHPSYGKAQERVTIYERNSQLAQKQASTANSNQ